MDLNIIILFIAFAVSVVVGSLTIKQLRRFKVGQIERDDGPQSHLGKKGTPTMGGIIIILTMIMVIAGLYFYLNSTNQGDIASKLIPMLILTIGFGIVGFIDDFKKLILKNTKGLKPSYKMFGLLLISVAFVVYLIYGLKIGTETYIPIAKIYVTLPVYFYIPFTIMVILGTTNAINLTDGVDGLSSSVSSLIISTLTIIGIQKNIPEIGIFGSVIIGATLGFLMYNLHPAKVFMGDTGSLFLGGVISGMALYLKMPLILVLIALIPVLETISVMMQVAYFKKTGKRIFKMAPLHHHFELSGWSENKVVIVFGLITLGLCVLGLQIV